MELSELISAAGAPFFDMHAHTLVEIFHRIQRILPACIQYNLILFKGLLNQESSDSKVVVCHAKYAKNNQSDNTECFVTV